mgnify:FL=1
MNKILAFACFCLFCAGNLIAQDELCKGAYFTEAQGKAFLEEHTPASVNEWQHRANQIRARIREGIQLKTMPAKPVSEPIIHSKKIMDGYTVENVAFES